MAVIIIYILTLSSRPIMLCFDLLARSKQQKRAGSVPNNF